MLRGIVGFRFVITRIERKWKMSQNRELNDQLGVAEGLGQRAEGDDLEIARLIPVIVPRANVARTAPGERSIRSPC